jgi:hypothetical protein
MQRPAMRAPQPQQPATVARPPQQAPAASRAVRQQQRQERIQQRQQRVQTPAPAIQQRQQAQPGLAVTRQVQPSTAPTRQQLQRVQREERTLRSRENRELRRLPAQQRAVRTKEIQRAREQRVQQRQQQLAPSTLRAPVVGATAPLAARRSGQARVTTQAARQGRFGTAFAGRAQARNAGANWRGAQVAARRAWRGGQRAGFVAWLGPVFWPYAYSDIFDYTFWPGGYDDGYWAYAYDDFFDGVFWGEQGPPVEYAYEPGMPRPSSSPAPRYAAVQELCKQPGTGITAWPFAEIEQKVGLSAEQKALLADVRKAGQDAAAVFKASCPADNAFPLTPPGRLQTMTLRLKATQQSVQTVRPALEKFYESLSDEQKERFNTIGPKTPSPNVEARQAQDVKSCKDPKAGLSNLPIEKIEDTVKPDDAQAASLDKLQAATDKAVGILQAACPDETPLTPPGRLEMMEKRLQAMIDAADTVQPALTAFYGALSNEQKARFNRIGRTLAQANE